MKAKKSFGQHFLKDHGIARRIAESLQLMDQYQHVLEIGPGKGMLTAHLLEFGYPLTVVEADKDMVDYLNIHLPELRDHIISEDFLRLKLEDYFGNEPIGIIGNFPYNISSQILFRTLDYKHQIPELVGMFQMEVGKRVCSGPGSKEYGVTSVLLQAYYETEYLFTVDRLAFSPPPKVQSGVIRLTRKENQDLGCDEKLFKRIVKQTFGQRRKMLRNTLKSFVKDITALQDPFFQKRPEALGLEEFVQVTRMVEGESKV